jgi:pimeloyl-ACP methyl ester carboxylesterase
MRRCATLALVAIGSCLAACGGHGSASSTASAASASKPKLTDAHPCRSTDGLTCATLSVPLDHAGQASGTLHLAVGFTTEAAAPRGVLVFLTGGPGQPGVSFLQRIRSNLGQQLHGYRLAMIDQRGTGAEALKCPALQAAAGSSDLVVPPPDAVPACAAAIGPSRRYFTTAETVADLNELRLAFHAPALTLDGVSYGTFVAERYALAYPTHVAKLVLDSVVPQQGADPLYLAALDGTARVLRSVCAQQHCGFDPARDVATVVRTRHDGPPLLNALVAESVAFPSFQGIPQALHQAARGQTRGLQALLTGVRRGETASANELSQGLHQSSVCVELGPPWDPAASSSSRRTMVERTVGRLTTAQVYPFDRATAGGNGLVQGCLQWPATKPPDLAAGDVAGDLPHVPVLLFSGLRDLSTPEAWAREEAATAPEGRLVTVPGAGHSVQLRARDPAVRRILGQFLGG